VRKPFVKAFLEGDPIEFIRANPPPPITLNSWEPGTYVAPSRAFPGWHHVKDKWGIRTETIIPNRRIRKRS